MGNQPDHERLAMFEGVYDTYRNRVHAYCARRRAPADAADAVSETFLIAWRRLGSLPDEPDTLPYLYGIASKVISNQRRSEKRRSRLNAKLGGLGVTPSADPVTVIVKRSEDIEVARAVYRLKAKDREIVMLYAWEGLSRAQIATVMNMSKAAVDQRIHRSYRRLARVLRPMTKRNPITPSITERGGEA